MREFADACRTFQRALIRRLYELREPGRDHDDDEIERLGRLNSEVRQASYRARRRAALTATGPDDPRSSGDGHPPSPAEEVP